MNVLVTGSASGFGQRLLERLAAETDVEFIIGVDQREAAFTHERFVQVLMDVRSPLLARVLRDIQVVIHLAPAASDAAAARGELLEAAQNLYTCAQAADIRQFIHLSSALVYAAHGEKPVPESQALGAVPGCAPAVALQAVEAWLDHYESGNPSSRLVRLRPHWLVGAHTDSVLARLLGQRFSARDNSAQLQCVHSDDVVEAILLAVRSEARGAFNLACRENATLGALHRQTQWLRIPVSPQRLAKRLGTAPGCIEALTHSRLLDSTRARTVLGWRPRHDRVSEILRQR